MKNSPISCSSGPASNGADPTNPWAFEKGTKGRCPVDRGSTDGATVVALTRRAVPKLFGRHILIAEDEMMIALFLADTMSTLGCTSVTASRVAKAISLAESQAFDAAILDLNLAGSPGYPVADALSRRGIPFVIATGYGAESIAADYARRPLLAKPFLPQHVEAALLKVLAR
jgi:CheY-like chemotaxis protein